MRLMATRLVHRVISGVHFRKPDRECAAFRGKTADSGAAYAIWLPPLASVRVAGGFSVNLFLYGSVSGG